MLTFRQQIVQEDAAATTSKLIGLAHNQPVAPGTPTLLLSDATRDTIAQPNPIFPTHVGSAI
jgi:hypothetical protein